MENDLIEAAKKYNHLSDANAQARLYASHGGEYGIEKVAAAVRIAKLINLKQSEKFI